ncbi:hypothetical protein M426DRAFT_262182 [Hypoxylon sp. CI-4A]|nr:hypothetical protein M426DRAFT_262182 [Hypoxylon sp. CI-4A]
MSDVNKNDSPNELMSDVDSIDTKSTYVEYGAILSGDIFEGVAKEDLVGYTEDRALERSSSIFDDWDTLFYIIDQYEKEIQNRWKGMSRNERVALLLKVDPELPPMHSPHVQLWKNRNKTRQPEKLNYTTIILPYLNLEDLTKEEPILLLLNSRARNPPDDLYFDDWLSLGFAAWTRLIKRTQLPGYFMIFRDSGVPHLYGKIYSTNNGADRAKFDPTREVISPCDGLWVLELQYILYRFLVEFCSAILHDIPEDNLVLEDAESVPEPPLPSSKFDTNNVRHLGIAVFEERYRPSLEPDFARVESLLAAKSSAAEDHLRALRVKPNYLLHTAYERAYHMLERLPDTDGGVHPLISRDNPQASLLGKVFATLMFEALEDVYVFSALHSKIFYLRQLLLAYKGKMDPSKELPHELTTAYQDFVGLVSCSNQAILSTSALRKGLYSSPPLREHFRRQVPCQKNSFAQLSYAYVPTTPDPKRDHLLYLVENIGDVRSHSILGSRGLLTELDLFIRREPSVKPLLSSWVANRLSTQGILHECSHQMKRLQPWSLGVGARLARDRYSSAVGLGNCSAHLKKMRNLSDDFWFHATGMIGHDFCYPEDHPYSEERVKEMRKAEVVTERFWHMVIGAMESAQTMSPRVRNLLPKTVLPTPPWSKAHQESANAKLASSMAESLHKIDLKERDENKMKGLEFERKEESSKAAETIYEVDARAFNTLKIMLSDDPSAFPQPKHIPWEDVVYTMQSLGYEAEKLFGSAWWFKISMEDPQQDINILLDEPYMGDKLDWIVARHYGARCKKAIGWELEMFKLSEEEDDDDDE